MKKIIAKILRGIVWLVGQFPICVHHFFARFIAWILRSVVHYRYDVVMVNLARSFPEKKYGELKKIASRFYLHLADIFAEAIWFGGSSYRRLYKSGVVTVTNPETMNEYIHNSPSVTVLFSHCGNWEILGGLLGCRTATGEKIDVEEKDITVVYKRLTSEISDEFFRRNRVAALEEVGTECEVESQNILRYVIRHRAEKRLYIYIADQCPYKGSGVHPIGEFLNQPTCAMLGSMSLAHKMSHSVVYMKMKSVARGKYEMTFIPICMNASEMSPEDIARKYYDILEEEIRETPHNWLWTHKRWKK